MTLEECNVSLFDECQKRGQEIAKLERELQEAKKRQEYLLREGKDMYLELQKAKKLIDTYSDLFGHLNTSLQEKAENFLTKGEK